jgi:hypothetical protein
MEQPIKYSDLLQPDNSIEQAITQLEKLNETYSATLKNVKNEAIKLQASIENVSGATEEHRTKIRETTAQVDKLTKAQQDLEFATSETAKQIAVLKEQQREAQNIAKLTAKLNNSEAGSYNALSAQYSLNKIQLNKLSQEYRENTEAGKKLVKETEEIYAKMKVLQEATGKYQLNVGNYKSAWDGLGVSAQQLVRELPSLAVSANTFFLAISNNIPMLVDEINKVKAANKAAAAEGQATVPVWKQVTKAFLSYNTAISLGITLLTVYGGDLIEWVAKMLKAEKQTDYLKEALDGVNTAMQDGQKEAQQSVVRLNLLYNATQDTTRSIEERKAAVDELQKQYPAYFKNISDEEILAGKAAKAYNELSNAILKSAMARAAEDKLVENSKKILELEEKRAQLEKERQKAQTVYNKQLKLYNNLQGEAADFQMSSVNTSRRNVNNLTEDITEANRQISALLTANKKLAKNIDVRSLTATPGKTETTKVRTKRTPKDRTQTINSDNLKITKELYESQTELITDELERQRKALQDTYNAEVADLQNKLKNDKDLTAASRENINQIIKNKQQKLASDLAALDVQQQQRDLQTQQQTLQLRLEAAEQGSHEENNLRIQLIENARQQELLANKQLTEEERQSEADINAKYNRQILEQDKLFQTERSTMLFDLQQALSASEFALLESTEGEKTRFRLRAERERLQQILKLSEDGGKKLKNIEIQTIQNTIAAINKEIEKSEKSDKQHRDIYDLVGLKLDDEQKQAISESVGFSISQLSSLLDAQVQLKEQALQNAQEEVDAAQSKVDAEIEARNNGYANDVATAQKELEMAKKNEQKALKEKQKAQKQQQALDTLTQTSSLITASAEIWKSFAGLGPLGIAAAIAAIATMWTSFAAAQIKARQVTKMQDAEYGEGGMEFIEGGSHQSGNDVDLGTMPDGRRRRAEGGEAFAIINKTSTRKYRKALPGIIKSINNGTFEKKYMGAFASDGLSISVNGSKFDSRALEKDVREIKEQGKRRYIVDSSGRIIETYKNLKRRYN